MHPMVSPEKKYWDRSVRFIGARAHGPVRIRRIVAPVSAARRTQGAEPAGVGVGSEGPARRAVLHLDDHVDVALGPRTGQSVRLG